MIKSRIKRGIFSALLGCLAACGGPDGVSWNDTDPSADTAPRLPRALADPRFAGADLARGELLSLACQACHTLRPGDEHLIGPNLFGVFGRPAASMPDFEYSEALLGSGLTWTVESVDAWLAGPDTFLAGNNMVFAGYSEPEDRRDLLAFLVLATSEKGKQ